MRGRPAVGIHDDLAPRETAVALGAANHEPARWVDQDLGVPLVVEAFGHDRLDHGLQHIALDLVLRPLLVLGAY